MIAPQTPAALALEAADKLQALAATLTWPLKIEPMSRHVEHHSRLMAALSFARWALCPLVDRAGALPEFAPYTTIGAYDRIAPASGGISSRTSVEWSVALRKWAQEQTPEPWVLVAPGMACPYWGDDTHGNGVGGWTPDLAMASRYSTRGDAEGGAPPYDTVAAPLSQAERTAYPNGKPGAARGEAPAAATPASTATPPGAAQGPTVSLAPRSAGVCPHCAGLDTTRSAASPPRCKSCGRMWAHADVVEKARWPTVGERLAAEWWGPDRGHDGVRLDRLGPMIDAAIREARETATRIIKDGAESSIQDLTTESEMLAARLVDAERELAEAVKDRDDYVRMLAKSKQELSDLRTGIERLIARKAG